MVYMGSKRKYCKDIVPIIQKYIDEHNITTFVDAFCGGANLADKIKCENVIANDLSPTLIAIHKKVQSNPSEVPEHCTREDWDTAYNDWKIIKKTMDEGYEHPKVETTYPYWKIGAIEWYASFSNGGFPRGYAKPSHDRDYYNEAYRNHQKQSQEENYKKIHFQQGDYRFIVSCHSGAWPNTLVYCDSPYKGTKPYAINPKFNFEEYYDWLRIASQYYPIFISEQEMPEDFPVIWEKDVKRTAGKDNNFKAIEKLYLIGDKNNG